MKPCRIVRLGGAIVLLFGKFHYLCDAKIGCGLALLSPFAIFVYTKIGGGSAMPAQKQAFGLSLLSPFAIFAIQRQRTVLSGTVAVVT
ncbi:hypothetical protein [Bacteroides thetaiotaomicron]|uniref:hypothetical protein n=1 Tax=Bacteroides thetaiotaomicron TaxID=818 RepID=UPI0022208160|nr:hypothetical protein [Bacteroides thetaiotaomicron]UYU79260.1 hypothetical protein KQP72_17670 [Bacteroides thetaiotaomicron]